MRGSNGPKLCMSGEGGVSLSTLIALRGGGEVRLTRGEAGVFVPSVADE